MIIGINGYIGSGKDTTGEIIQYLTGVNTGFDFYNTFPKFREGAWNWENISGWKVKKFAEKLKQVASLLTGIPREKFEDQEFKKSLLGPEWNIMLDHYSGADPVKYHGKQESPMTVRLFLQKLGTEAIRNGVHTNAWVNALMSEYKPNRVMKSDGPASWYEEGTEFPNWIITDCRFPNEAQAIREKGGLVIRVNRGTANSVLRGDGMWVQQQGHPSETSLDDYTFDYVLDNSGDINHLIVEVEKMLKMFNII